MDTHQGFNAAFSHDLPKITTRRNSNIVSANIRIKDSGPPPNVFSGLVFNKEPRDHFVDHVDEEMNSVGSVILKKDIIPINMNAMVTDNEINSVGTMMTGNHGDETSINPGAIGDKFDQSDQCPVTVGSVNNTLHDPLEEKRQVEEPKKENSDSALTMVQRRTCAREPKVLNKATLEKLTDFVRDHRENVTEQNVDHTVQPPADGNIDMLKEDDISSTKKKKKAWKKRKRKSSYQIDEVQNEDEIKEPKKKRPNYFIAIQVSNPVIQRELQMLQDHVIHQEPLLSAARIPVPTLHLTMFVTYIDNSNMDRAVSALDVCHKKLSHLTDNPLILGISGIANFQNNVVFAKVKDGVELERLTTIAKCVSESFTEQGIMPGDEKGFKPHLTIFKLSKAPNLRRKGIRKIAPSLYSELGDTEFGYQTVKSLQLCAMLKPKDHLGYYHTHHTVHFVPETYVEADGMSFCDKSVSPESTSGRLLVSTAITTALHTLRQEKLCESRKRKVSELSEHKARLAVQAALDDLTCGDNLHTAICNSRYNRHPAVFIAQLEKELAWKFEINKEPTKLDILEMLKDIS